MDEEGQQSYAPNSSDVLAACDVVRTLSNIDERRLLEFAPNFGRIIRAWVASLDLGAEGGS